MHLETTASWTGKPKPGLTELLENIPAEGAMAVVKRAVPSHHEKLEAVNLITPAAKQ
jgi:hypothetical protein